MQEAFKTAFEPLVYSTVPMALAMCDQYVGENLYTKQMLLAAIDEKDHFFYFIVDDAGKPLGYIYFRLIDRMEFLLRSRADRHIFDSTIPQDAILGELKSIAVCEEYRHLGLSERLLELYLNVLRQRTAATVAIGIFWSIHGFVPMQKSLEAFSFRYLQTTHKVWYDVKDLKCPYCDGRCVCDAAVYYKKLEVKS